MLSFTACFVLLIILVIICFVFNREFKSKKKVTDFEVKFPEDKIQEKVFFYKHMSAIYNINYSNWLLGGTHSKSLEAWFECLGIWCYMYLKWKWQEKYCYQFINMLSLPLCIIISQCFHTPFHTNNNTDCWRIVISSAIVVPYCTCGKIPLQNSNFIVKI